MSDRQSPWPGAILLFALAAYCLGGPILSFLLLSWWPMLIGLGAVFAVLLTLVGVHVLKDAREEPQGIEQAVLNMVTLGEQARLERLQRERQERRPKGDQ